MARRSGWKSGDWLVKDEESGFTTYGSKVAYDYYGVLKLKSQGDHAHPQDFVKALEDPYPVYPVSQPFRDYNLTESVVGFYVGNTHVSTVDGPALHLYRPGVDLAEVEYDDFVYGPPWTPYTVLQGNLPLLWMDASSGINNNGNVVDGTPVFSWSSQDATHAFLQSDASKMPVYRMSGINNQPAIDFDGVDDLLVSSTAFLTGTRGTVILVTKCDVIGGTQIILASADEAVIDSQIWFSVENTGRPLFFQVNRDGVGDQILNESNVGTGTIATTWNSNDVKYTLRYNGLERDLTVISGANNGDWWDSSLNKDNVTIGGLKANTEKSFFNGRIAEILVYPSALSYESLQTVSLYIATKYGVQI